MYKVFNQPIKTHLYSAMSQAKQRTSRFNKRKNIAEIKET